MDNVTRFKTAVLVDTVSIQEYIFSSNKLKEIIGASYIVERLYENDMCDVLLQHFNGKYAIGYIGGGNALVFFESVNIAREFIKEFSKYVLENSPGIRLSFGINENFDHQNFKQSMRELHENLKFNKNSYFPNVLTRNFGFTLECKRSRRAVEIFNGKTFEDEGLISKVSLTKLKASEKAKEELFGKIVSSEITESFSFAYELEDVADDKDPYIAVIHIDGNKIGEKLSKCNSIGEIRSFSSLIDEVTKKAFEDTVKSIIDFLKKDNDSSSFKKDERNGKTILPLRPIIIAGDEITVISKGNIGIFFVEKYMKFFEKYSLESMGSREKLTCSAGVSIVKQKFPFYKAYSIAEFALNKAKRESRKEENSDTSWFYFYIVNFGNAYKENLDKLYNTPNGNLRYGPYCLNENKRCSFSNLKKLIKLLKELPKNKVLKIREILFENYEIRKAFINELIVKGITIPDIEDSGREIQDFWNNKRTLFFDAIELLDLYPEVMLNEGQNENT
ncbi:MAG: hypothetical protein QW051_03580 [Candidatus Aenigmatarchaeota archaeon]